jgi:hypothetical protein
VRIGARGLQADPHAPVALGTVRLVYPEIKGGRVLADVEASGLGTYFVGERARVDVAAGSRSALTVPAAFMIRRAGVTYVRLKDGPEVVVQTGLRAGEDVEVLAGLNDGDVVVSP